MAAMSPLRRRMIEDMTVRNLSPATQRSYVSAVAKFSRHFGGSPDRLNLEDVRAFQVHLVSIGISWPALNQIVCALRFFYGVTLGGATIPERIPYAREPRKLPVVLSSDEVVAFLEAVPSLKSRAALTAAYALIDRKAPGQPSKLNEAHRAALATMIESGPIPAVHGVVRWRLVDLCQWIFDEFRITVSTQTLSRELRARGYRKLSARPRHHDQAEGAIEDFKKASRGVFTRSRGRRASSQAG